MEGTEEDRISPRPSTVISPIQGYVSLENPYHPVYMMPPNTYPNQYSYHWGSQHLPTIPYPPLSNPEDFRRFQETIQHPSTMSYPPSSNPERFQETPQHPVQSSIVPDESEKNVASISHMNALEVEGSNEVSNTDETNEVLEAKGTNEVSDDDDERVEEPKSGMEFSTEKDLLAYYKRYAKQSGFGVKTFRTKREADGSAKYLTIGCARGGTYHPSHSNVSRPRPTTKTNCKAKVNAKLVNGVWVLTTIQITHNHNTVSPQKSRFFRSHKCLDEYSQRMLDLNDRAGIRMNKNFQALVVDADGFENLEFQEKDARNFINKARHLRLGKGGGEALSDYFERMSMMNDGFVSVMDVDDKFRVRNVFWADTRSRAAYEYFGDVITFDTTYLTNRYNMPFAPFVGVNHHGQFILLGAGLISNEDTNTFVWLFRAWLKCMNGQAPKAIITDQDRAMKSAIAIVFPDSRHRYYLWHIMRKLPEKLGSHSQFNAGLKSAIQNALYDSQSCTEFEDKWENYFKSMTLGRMHGCKGCTMRGSSGYQYI
ncbi:protein FAR1-RELATED SEQUENCE 5-like [Juglans regia]|uniref:Protein FAR1-RELATED SEQUENCE n=2 Tax=Juglans regia TaxID=51240 RepID=A0A2I4FFD9_JUGRE|nr:protein FAR1-RELATED SEQUENCE 5-like [Juglans regia]